MHSLYNRSDQNRALPSYLGWSCTIFNRLRSLVRITYFLSDRFLRDAISLAKRNFYFRGKYSEEFLSILLLVQGLLCYVQRNESSSFPTYSIGKKVVSLRQHPPKNCCFLELTNVDASQTLQS